MASRAAMSDGPASGGAALLRTLGRICRRLDAFDDARSRDDATASDTLVRELRDAKSRVTELIAELRRAEREDEAADEFDALRHDIDAQSAAAEAAGSELRRCRAALKQARADKSSVEEDRERIRAQLHDARERLKTADAADSRRDGAVTAVRRRLEAVCRARDAAKDAQQRAEERAKAAEADIAGLRRRAAAAESQRVDLVGVRANLTARDQSVAALQQEKDALLDHVEESDRRIEALSERLRRGAAAIADAEAWGRKEAALRGERDEALRSATQASTRAAECEGRMRAAETARAEAEERAAATEELEAVQAELLSTITAQATGLKEAQREARDAAARADAVEVRARREERRWKRAEALLERYRGAERRLLGPAGVTMGVESSGPAVLGPGLRNRRRGLPGGADEDDEDDEDDEGGGSGERKDGGGPALPRVGLEDLERRLRKRLVGEARADAALASREERKEREGRLAEAEARLADATARADAAEARVAELSRWRAELRWAEGVAGVAAGTGSAADAARLWLSDAGEATARRVVGLDEGAGEAEVEREAAKRLSEDAGRAGADGWHAQPSLAAAVPMLASAAGKAASDLGASRRRLALAEGEVSDLRDELLAVEQAERRGGEAASDERRRLRAAVRRLRAERDEARRRGDEAEAKGAAAGAAAAEADAEAAGLRRRAQIDDASGRRRLGEEARHLREAAARSERTAARLRAERDDAQARLGQQAQYAARAMALVRERDVVVADLEARSGMRARLSHAGRARAGRLPLSTPGDDAMAAAPELAPSPGQASPGRRSSDDLSLTTEDAEVTDAGADRVVASLSRQPSSPDSLALSSSSGEALRRPHGAASGPRGAASASFASSGWSSGGGQLGRLASASPSSRTSTAMAELRRVQGQLGDLERQLRQRM